MPLLTTSKVRNISFFDLQSKALPGWLQECWPIVIGIFALYVPTYYDVTTGLWKDEDHAHGPIVLIMVLFLIWQQRHSLLPAEASSFVPSQGKGRNERPINLGTWPDIHSILGWSLMMFGLLCYVLGRSQDILMLDIGSQIPVFTGILLITRGMPALRAMWFPLFFIFFMIPLPGFFVDAVTLPMKMAVSSVAESVLHWLDYPIARAGVILHIGQYQLLVADACAGLHTLISLEALGLLYLHLVKHDSILRNMILAILIVPISFSANVVRVMVLTLVTYYFGDAAGRGFVHGFAGMTLFIVALVLIMGVDAVLQYVLKRHGEG